MAGEDSTASRPNRPAPRAPGPVIEIAPNPALIDQRVSVTVRGLAPGVPVTIRASLDDELGRTWSSWARYLADGHGDVDVAAQPSEDGTYQGTDFSGLFWSMELDPGRSDRSPFP